MNKENFSTPLALSSVKITDSFWGREQELVRREVIPYQWEALNDRVPGASPSYCMRNFRVAGRLMQEKREQGTAFAAPAYTFRGFEALPEDPANPEPDKFYGFVFQDSDFAKWIEAVGYSLTNHPDPELEKLADGAIDIVCAAQSENGYLDTYYIINGMDRIFTNLRDHHELYCFGHLVEGAVAYYQATGKDKLLKTTERYADFICSQFGPEEGKRKGYPGHEIAEMALAKLYEATGERKYLDLSSFFLDVRGNRPYYFDLEEKERAEHEGKPYRKPGEELRFQYHQAHLPVREQTEAVGHAVRAVYLYSGMADIARLKEDEEMFAACERLWNNITEEKLYITGGIGGTPVGEAFSFPYDLPNDTAYSETCAAIGLAFFARRMLQIQADSRYSDVMEQALYNTVLAGMALDGKSFFYVNPLEVYPEACRRDDRKRHVTPIRQKWFGCACCPPNIARIVSSLGAYAYTENKNTLYTHLYVGSSVRANLEGGTLEMTVESNFPWEGEVRAIIKEIGQKRNPASEDAATEVTKPNAAKAASNPDTAEESTIANTLKETVSSVSPTLAFRIPGWCRQAQIEVRRNQKTESGEDTSFSFINCTLERKGKEMQLVSLAVRQEVCPCMEKADNRAINPCIGNADGQGINPRVESADEQAINLCMKQTDGQGISLRTEKGYCYLTAPWQTGDEILLHFPMEVRCIRANGKVREDIGKVAFTRGPICYCMEEADNGKELWLLQADMGKLFPSSEADSALPVPKGITVETSTELGHEMRVLKVPGLRQMFSNVQEMLYEDFHPMEEREVTLTLIPYYAWSNRGEGEMSVWIHGL